MSAWLTLTDLFVIVPLVSLAWLFMSSAIAASCLPMMNGMLMTAGLVR